MYRYSFFVTSTTVQLPVSGIPTVAFGTRVHLRIASLRHFHSVSVPQRGVLDNPAVHGSSTHTPRLYDSAVQHDTTRKYEPSLLS